MSNQEMFKDMQPNYDYIPIKERLDFQKVLILNMLPENFRDKPRQEQILLEIDWANQYAKKVSTIIDDPKNKEIRDYIFEGKYKEAAEILELLLKQ